jgi:hypothetical protein
MNYNHHIAETIISMDYSSLVHLLTTQITPELRKKILIRLMEINDSIILKNLPSSNIVNNMDLSRNPIVNNRKKDLNMLPHPATDIFNNKGTNPIPINMPASSNYPCNEFNNLYNYSNNLCDDSINLYQMNHAPNLYHPSNNINTIPNNINTIPNNINTIPNNINTIPNIYQQTNNINNNIQCNNCPELDDLINDLYSEPDDLDIELNKIKNLYDKIKISKRNKRRESKLNNNLKYM